MQAHLQHIAYGFSSPKHTNVSKTYFHLHGVLRVLRPEKESDHYEAGRRNLKYFKGVTEV